MDKIKTPPTLEDMIKHLPEKTYLTYVEREDSLDNKLDAVQEAIHQQEYCPIDEAIEDWVNDDYEAVKEYISELKDKLEEIYDIEDLECLVAAQYSGLREAIQDRDHSNPLDDLLRNTGKHPMFYETGYEMPEFFPNVSGAQIRLTRIEIKKHLGIKGRTWDKDIDSIIANASYGGKLVVFFCEPVGDFICRLDKIKSVKFGDPNLAIIDNRGGSGADEQLKGCTLHLPFSPKRIFLDAVVNYSYTYAVCGMSYNWCDDTKVTMLEEDSPVVWKECESATEEHMSREKKRNATFKAGKCTPGDMNINRHRDTYYINDYPCGTKCPHCGTFWID